MIVLLTEEKDLGESTQPPFRDAPAAMFPACRCIDKGATYERKAPPRIPQPRMRRGGRGRNLSPDSSSICKWGKF